MNERIFVTGIGTGVGKTVVSAILVKALNAEYWKPIQSGDLDNSDSMLVHRIAGNPRIHPESYRLTKPLSPHAAANLDKITIDLSRIQMPITNASLVIEGAGGLLVPLNSTVLMIDLIQQLKVPVVLVSRNYLGSINHTLLSFEALRSRDIPILGLIFNSSPNIESESYIEEYTKLPVLGRIADEIVADSAMVSRYALQIKDTILCCLSSNGC